MASIIQRRLSRAGLSRQTAKGTAATAATYGYGVDGGSICKLDLTENEIPLTWSNRDILGFDRQGVKPGQDVGTLGTPNLLGLLLLGVLGSDAVTSTPVTITAMTNVGTTVTATVASSPLYVGQQIVVAGVAGFTTNNPNGTWTVASITGGIPGAATQFTFVVTAAPTGAYTASSGTVTPGYTHTISPAAVLPYMTAWGSFGTADWAELQDSKVSSIELSWEEAGKVAVKATVMSCNAVLLAAAYTETTLELPSAVGYFTAGGGAFSVEGRTYAVSGGSIKFDTHIDQPIASATVLPADVVEGKLQTDWSLKILPTSTDLFRETYYGSTAPGALSTIQPFPHLGSVSCQFSGPTGDTLVVSSPQVRFMVAFPESSPEGGPAELTLAGTSVLPTSGQSVTAVLNNQVAAY
jgi:hypothetical protein